MSLVFATNENNDIYAEGGLLVYKTGKEGVAQSVGQAVKANLNEMIYAKNEGVDYLDNVFTGSFNIVVFEAQARRQILNTLNVAKIVSFLPEVSGGVLSYSSIIKTTFGTITIEGAF